MGWGGGGGGGGVGGGGGGWVEGGLSKNERNFVGGV